jgi:hypothetical protein
MLIPMLAHDDGSHSSQNVGTSENSSSSSNVPSGRMSSRRWVRPSAARGMSGRNGSASGKPLFDRRGAVGESATAASLAAWDALDVEVKNDAADN